jgi:hypothetical protein
MSIELLQRRYTDNATYRDTIVDELFKRGLVEYVNSEAVQDDHGFWCYVNDLPKHPKTSEAGETALKNHLFPSEIAKESIDNRYRYLQIVGIAVAAIGGLITIATFLYKHIHSLFK